MVSASVKEQKGAVLYGQNTFGKGSMQSLFTLSDQSVLKLIKSFCEGIGYLEGVLLFQRHIHPSNIEHSYWAGKEAAYMEALKEVDLIVKESINRQYRHFCIFL